MASIAKQTNSFESSDGTRIFYRRLVPENVRLKIVVSHGLGEHSGRYGHVADTLCPLGAALWIPDHRGHGESQGKRGHINTFNDYVGDLRRLVSMAAADGAAALPTLLLGHSMGGLIALSFARQYPGEIDGLIVSSPLLGVSPLPPILLRGAARLLSVAWPTLPLSNKLDPAFISHDPDQVAAYIQDERVHEKISARWFVACLAEAQRTRDAAQAIGNPILMQIAGDDRLVDPKASLAFFDALTVSDKTLCHYEALYHEIYNETLPERRQVLVDLKEWIAERFL